MKFTSFPNSYMPGIHVTAWSPPALIRHLVPHSGLKKGGFSEEMLKTRSAARFDVSSACNSGIHAVREESRRVNMRFLTRLCPLFSSEKIWMSKQRGVRGPSSAEETSWKLKLNDCTQFMPSRDHLWGEYSADPE